MVKYSKYMKPYQMKNPDQFQHISVVIFMPHALIHRILSACHSINRLANTYDSLFMHYWLIRMHGDSS